MINIFSRAGEEPSKNLINSISHGTPLISVNSTTLSLLSIESEGHSFSQKSKSSVYVETFMSDLPCQIQISNKP